MDLLGGGPPARRALLVAAQPRQSRAAVGGDPAEELGGREVLRLATHLPDPTVRLAPALERRVDLTREQRPEPIVEAITGPRVEPDRVEQHAPDIVLSVVPGVVADPDRVGALVAGEMIEGPLVELPAPVDAVHDLKLLVLHPVRDEVEVVRRLAIEAEGRKAPQ